MMSKMRPLYFSTGNEDKYSTATLVLKSYGIVLEQKELEISEAQSDDLEYIISDKLDKAYDILQQPVIVSDDSWHIVALNGFPGPYMKSINKWLTSEDLLRLTKPLTDRQVLLTQQVGYRDANRTKLFSVQTPGIILSEAKGEYGTSAHKIFAMHGDGGLSLAEYHDRGEMSTQRDVTEVWHNFAAWYCQKPRP
jgi:XTP/dITP diphosphohydrolase